VTVTLAQIEQEASRRIGPYWRFFSDRQLPNTAQFTFVNLPELRSDIDQDLVTNLWMLRRGERFDDMDIVLMDPEDRLRSVSVYDAQQGRVFPDRPWSVIPQDGEYFEFHHLHPEQELRPAVLAGLARCFFRDMVKVPATWQYGGFDLTASYPWIMEPWQVSRVQYGYWFPDQDIPFEVIQMQGHLVVVGGGFTYAYLPQTLWVTYWRPHTSWVNGADSTTGPTEDTDTLDCDLSYAAAAGHIEAWHLFPSRCQAAAAGGMQATQAMAAQEFTRQALMRGPTRPTQIGFQSIGGMFMGGVNIGA
jgi:hypothetical protein